MRSRLNPLCLGSLLFFLACPQPAQAQLADLPWPDSDPARSDYGPHDPPAEQARQRRDRRGGPVPPLEGVYRSRVEPHWFANDTRFWYRNDLRGGAKEFILVHADTGRRQPAFDHAKLAAALAKATGQEVAADKLPFSAIEFVQDGQAVKIRAADKTWLCNLESYDCLSSEDAAAPTDSPREENPQSRRRRPNLTSPDGKWTAFVKDRNVFVRGQGEEKEIQLSTDGEEGNYYDRIEWAPDSKTLVAWRIQPGERKEVYLVRSSPDGGGRARLETRPYALPGDKFARYEPNLFDVAARKQTRPEVDAFEHEWESPGLRWSVDGSRFAYRQVDRGHQRLRVIEIAAGTGAVRNLVDERSQTFIWTAHNEELQLTHVNWLEKSDEFIYVSEQDGWRHLYLVDAQEGKIKNQITKGPWVVRGIDRIDEEQRQVWFTANGVNPGQDPYFIHYYRINFDGSGLVALTDANGTHRIQYSPERKYLVDTYSRVDAPPATDLRRTSDGRLVCELERADIADLKTNGWSAPEVFVAKGRDGTTDIWGVICRPRNFDPAKKYPVIEAIYAGPQGSFVPKAFSPRRMFSAYTDLGFIAVQIDGMGTANRSKAFHDVCFKNLKDAGFPDRILWHKAVARAYPYYDVDRVGLIGTSAGGQNAAGGVLFHPEFYKAAVANCGCHDNRMDKASWNEQWMSYPVGSQYAECSNIDNAWRLKGKLFLLVGEMDHNVPPESTYRLADALIKAGKDFDYLVVPNEDHGIRGAARTYVDRRVEDFFVRHLQGKEPPDRNAAEK